ncbi:amino acid ABC transporter substrate-binding protein [Parasphaerochaeta coccoides]|uniref:Amino acid ABC transporter substrate-binding protein, PAAT family n=1 Tax=Parasphaerochaeta coccoides (strain ATCC BAA-1237 / DSM 17374 / SPN1) TaxID=760011 RepID=F4GH72_PARC1|nr:amino acid ABC transporter substrate-binding protein [Parasphaerochaeta coccoides]AEC01547.1 amino acid ABC transporter substrate-binding protein, PAAT family [Parasphaerochaeta coccoides DSM 17374]
MKKTLALCVMILAAVSLFAAGSKESGEDSSLKKIQDRGTFILGLDDTFPPMGFRNENNEIVGFDIDLAREVTKRMGVTLLLQPIDWNAKEQELNTGKIDCIWNGFTVTEERKKVVNFSEPYLENAQVAVVKTSSAVTTLADLAGKSIGLQAGSSASNAVDAAPVFKASLKGIVEFKENLTALMDLEIGGVDAVIVDLLVANDNIKRSGKDFRILDESLAPENYAIGFRKNDNALRNAVQKHLDDMAADGTMARISTTWFGADITIVGK